MRVYKVILTGQKEAGRSHHRTDWIDLHEEIHRIEAAGGAEAVVKARNLVGWINIWLSRSKKRVVLHSIYNPAGKCIWSRSGLSSLKASHLD